MKLHKKSTSLTKFYWCWEEPVACGSGWTRPGHHLTACDSATPASGVHQTRERQDAVDQTRPPHKGNNTPLDKSRHSRSGVDGTISGSFLRKLSCRQVGMAGQPRVALQYRKDKEHTILEHSVLYPAESENDLLYQSYFEK